MNYEFPPSIAVSTLGMSLFLKRKGYFFRIDDFLLLQNVLSEICKRIWRGYKLPISEWMACFDHAVFYIVKKVTDRWKICCICI